MNVFTKYPKNILVRTPNWIGDQILAFPFFYFLRRAFPESRIVSACPAWVESIQFRDLVDEVVVLPRVLSPGWFSRLESIEKSAQLLRKKGPWDLAISLPNSFTAAWQIFRAEARIRRGYSMEGRGILLNERVSWKEGALLHRADAYLKLLPSDVNPEKSALEFWGVPAENELDPPKLGILYSFPAEKAWPVHELIEPPAQKYWILAPGSIAESRRWPVERFASLARKISKKTGWVGVVVGGPAEAVLAEKLCSADENDELRLLDYTARGPVSSLWKIFQQSQFTVSNDSGLAHVAALCGSPVQVIWGAGDPKRTRPIGPKGVQLALNATDCWPCERNFCENPEEKRLDCLNGILVENVWNQIESQILRLSRGKENSS